MSTKENTRKKPNKEGETNSLNERFLILHNDDHHSFDYVIDALIKICDHEEEQAIQCTLLTHYRGKCDVKKGTFNYLRPIKKALAAKDLKATID